MILYFSGTGNSRYAAEKIAEKTGDEVVSLNNRLKKKETEPLVSERPFIFVCPTYAWRIPRVVEELLRRTDFKGTNQVYFILTCGGETANAIHYVDKLCEHKGWNLLGFAEVIMQDNYIVMFPSIDKKKAQELTEAAEKKIAGLAESIGSGDRFLAFSNKGFLGKMESGFVNHLFYPMFVHAKGFYATEKCIGCKKCEKICPLNNIVMKEQRPVWSDSCTHCMACINICPQEAIEYKNKTQGKTRYFLNVDKKPK